jgi:hypothetical protein
MEFIRSTCNKTFLPFLPPIMRSFLSLTRRGGVTFRCIRKVSRHELRKWRGCRHVEAESNINRRGDMFIHFKRGYKKIGCGCKSQVRRVNRKGHGYGMRQESNVSESLL